MVSPRSTRPPRSGQVGMLTVGSLDDRRHQRLAHVQHNRGLIVAAVAIAVVDPLTVRQPRGLQARR
jgi:hypothetical protein